MLEFVGVILVAGSALAGTLLVLFACLDAKATLGGKQHYLLYALTPAMKPRMLMTGALGQA
jgi:26S proteasome regulatory subunit N1